MRIIKACILFRPGIFCSLCGFYIAILKLKQSRRNTVLFYTRLRVGDSESTSVPPPLRVRGTPATVGVLKKVLKTGRNLNYRQFNFPRVDYNLLKHDRNNE